MTARSKLSALACFLSVALGACAQAESLVGKVVAVSDGDTITVLQGERTTRVRLAGIDCPERRQPFGRRARQFTSEAVFSQVVTVEVLDRDRYDRIVGTVYTSSGHALNAELLQEGLAWWYRYYAPDRKDYEALEAEAREAKRGLWRDPNPVPPWEWRKRQPE